MVITFDNSTSAIAAYEQLQGRVYEDKKVMGKCFKNVRGILRTFYLSRQIINLSLSSLKWFVVEVNKLLTYSFKFCFLMLFNNVSILVIMLPTLEPEMIPSKTVPLLVFVNVKSGGCQVGCVIMISHIALVFLFQLQI